MGYYIETPGQVLGKANRLIKEHGAIPIPCPQSFNEIDEDEALICVIDNGMFEAAGYAFDEREFKCFNSKDDPRPRQWLRMDKALVNKLTGFGD